MTKQNNEKAQTFWLGFSIGTAAASAFIYLFGTKQGRSFLTRIIDFSENIETNISKMIKSNKKIVQKNNKELPAKIPALEKISIIFNEIKRISNEA